MIERQIINQNMKEYLVKEYLAKELSKTGYSHTEIKRTPLGEKVVIFTTRPGLVVGKKGDNIKRLTFVLKNRFKMENPQIEIGEVPNPNLDAFYMADKITSTLERFGSKRFKSIGYRSLQEIMDGGALGAEVVISGKVPSARARSWRFKAGYMKKSGDIAQNKVQKQCAQANLKSGVVGVKVLIMTPDIVLPDKITFKTIAKPEEKKEVEKPKAEIKPEKTKREVEKPTEKKKARRKKPAEKKEPKKETKKKETKKKNGNNQKK